MAKQTFTTGQVLTAAQMTNLQQTAMGGGSTTAKTVSYTLVAADAGTVIQMNSASATTITVNTGLFAAGDTIQIQNIGAGVCTVTAGTATVNTAGSLALSQYENGTLYFNSTSAAFFFDVFQSGGGGKVLQVVAATYATQALSTSTSYADTGLTATITPSLATSKVAVFINIGSSTKESSGGNTGGAVQTKAFRGATEIGFIESGYTGDTSRQDFGSISYAILDSPATTSATTYKAQFASLVSGQQVRVQTAGSTSSIILMEIGA